MAWQTVLNVAHVGLSIYQKNGENGYPKSLWLISIFLLLYINNFGATPIFKDAAIWVFPEIRQPEIIGFPIRNNTDLGWSWDPTEDFQRKFSDTNLLQSLGESFLGSENGRIWGIPLPSTTTSQQRRTAVTEVRSVCCALCPTLLFYIFFWVMKKPLLHFHIWDDFSNKPS